MVTRMKYFNAIMHMWVPSCFFARVQVTLSPVTPLNPPLQCGGYLRLRMTLPGAGALTESDSVLVLGLGTFAVPLSGHDGEFGRQVHFLEVVH